MNNNTIPWHKYLCEYYDISPEKALELGTRATGRKPNLPASKTCKAVSNMTYEDIWALSKRETQEEIFQFYIDQGAWATFRQSVRHRELDHMHNTILTPGLVQPGSHICEYGCGVAPFSYTLCTSVDPDMPLKISLSDIENSEHLHFAAYRLNRVLEDRNMKNVEITTEPIKADQLPNYDGKLDLVVAFEVMEHVPSPLLTLANLMSQMNKGAFYIENFIYTEGEEDLGPDLRTAAKERNHYYQLIEHNYQLAGGPAQADSPNATRFWRKKY
jgi:hypothetical protein